MRLIRNFRKRSWFCVLSVCMLLVLWRYWFLKRQLAQQIQPQTLNVIQKPLQLLWWTTMPAEYKSTRYCDMHLCTFTAQRMALQEAQAIIFYASDLSTANLPVPRLPQQRWALLHEESPRNVPYIPHESVLRHFNYTSTFSRYSDMPLTTHHLEDDATLTSPKYLVPIGEKTRLRKLQNLAPIAFLQTDCDTMSGRDEYVHDLMQYIEVDSYGKCLNNRDLPISLTEDYLNKLNSPELYRFLARYKFILAYENGVCYDYITEKFWRPLVIGAIPIYYGSPTIKDWAPNNRSVIYISDFASPKELALFIKELDRDDVKYNTYLDHKYDQLTPITNQRLLNALQARDYHDDTETPHSQSNFFNAFECYVCRQLHKEAAEMAPKRTRTATLSHYNCPTHLTYPAMSSHVNNSADWTSVLAVGRCYARVLDMLLVRNANYTQHEFDQLLIELVQANQCN